MGNPTNVINLRQSLAEFEAQYEAEFVTTKIDPPYLSLLPADIRERVSSLYGNTNDDFVRRVVEYVPRSMYDNRGSPIRTASIAGSGGTGDFEIDVHSAYGDLKALRVVSVGGASSDIRIQLFRNASRTDQVYSSLLSVDPSTQYTDRNPGTMIGNDFSVLENRKLYGRITNNGSTSQFDVEVLFWGL